MVRSQHGWVGYRERRCRCATCCGAYIVKMQERRKAVRKRPQRPKLHGWDTMTKEEYDRTRDADPPVRRAKLRDAGWL